MRSQEMNERVKDTYSLIPIADVDFEKPWEDIVEAINQQLSQLHYETFDSDIAKEVAICNLNKSNRPFPVDSVRVRYDVLNEQFPAAAQAAAKFGLEFMYWRGLYGVLPDKLFFDAWQKFSIIPVFKKGNENFLMGNNKRMTVAGIQYGGDGDMSSALSIRKVFTPIEDVSLEDLDIPYDLADRYLELRKKLSAAEEIALNTAVNDMRKSDIWPTITRWFPNADKEFNAATDFPFTFLQQATAMVDAAFPDVEPLSRNAFTSAFRNNVALDLSRLFYQRTRIDYGRSLRDDTDFHESIWGLSKVTEDLYSTAADASYFKSSST